MMQMQGWSDFPLTQEGVRIARQFGRGLKREGVKFSAAFCGKLTRHYDTARLALDASGNESVSIQIDPDLREVNFGSYEGRDANIVYQHVAEHLGYADFKALEAAKGAEAAIVVQDVIHDLDAANTLHTNLEPEDRAECSSQVRKRMAAAMDRVASFALTQGGGNVLVVSSGMSIRDFLLGVDPKRALANEDNTAVTKLLYADDHFTINGPVGSLAYYERGAE